MKPKLICGLCHKEIDTRKKYSHVEDYGNLKKTNEIWCHRECFKKGMNKDLTEAEKKAMKMLERLQPLLDQISPPREVFELS